MLRGLVGITKLRCPVSQSCFLIFGFILAHMKRKCFLRLYLLLFIFLVVIFSKCFGQITKRFKEILGASQSQRRLLNGCVSSLLSSSNHAQGLFQCQGHFEGLGPSVVEFSRIVLYTCTIWI